MPADAEKRREEKMDPQIAQIDADKRENGSGG